MSSPVAPLVAAALALLSAGCGPAPTATLGTETTGFVPLADGDDVEVVTGPMGLQMFVLAFRVDGIFPGTPDALDDPDNPDIALAITDPAGNWIGGTSASAGIPVAPDGDRGLSGIFTPFAVDPATFLNSDVTVTLTIVDRRGRTATDAVLVTAVPPQ
jgi:hypothetical protein